MGETNEMSGSAESHGIGPNGSPPDSEGLSLDKLNRAFAAMLDSGDDPYSVPTEPTEDPVQAAIVAEEREKLAAGRRALVDAACEINPRSILEAMLFVGTPDNRPLCARQIAGLMRGVRPAEIDGLAADLNASYAATARPFRIVSEEVGYRLSLASDFEPVRDKFYGRIKQARLSPAAIEVLAVVAYNEPLTAEAINQLRGTASGPILSQLVRRELLRIERPTEEPRIPCYLTTERFLRLVGVESLADLPRNLDLERL